MIHDHVLKSWILTPRVRLGGCLPSICYHDAAFMIPFNLICNMNMFWNSWISTFWPTLSPPRGSNPGFGTIIKFDMFHIYCTSACMPNFIKKYWQLRELVRNLSIWPLFPTKGSGGWGKILVTVMLIYRHWVILVLCVLFDSLCLINNLSVIKERVFQGWTSTKIGLMFLLKDTTQRHQWGSNPRSPVEHSTTNPGL